MRKVTGKENEKNMGNSFKLNREEFDKFLKSNLSDWIGSELQVAFNEIVKMNDTFLSSIEISKKSDPSVKVCKYFDELFEMYEAGWTLDAVIDSIMDATSIFSAQTQLLHEADIVLDYERVKGFLSMYLVGIEENQYWLKDKIWKPMGDFAKVCYIDLDNVEGMNARGMVTILREHLTALGVSEEQVWKDAEENFSREGYSFKSLLEMAHLPFDDGFPMYVLTNEDVYFGAALIAREDILSEIAEILQCSYYVLPSSVNEVMIVPESAGMSLQELENMVLSVNQEMLSPREKLSDKVQYYDSTTGSLCNAHFADGSMRGLYN